MDAGALGRRRRRGGTGFDPLSLFSNGEPGTVPDFSDLTPEKVSWRRNLLTWSESFENSAWTKTNSSILSNLLLWSEQFDNAYWTKQNVTITVNAITAPNGTATADAFVASAGTGTFRGVFAVENSATPKTLSCYVRKGDKRWVYLLGYNGNAGGICWFDLDNGVVGTRGANYSTSSIENVGSGWYRISAVMTAALGGNTNVGVYASDADNSTSCTGDGSTVTMYVWGAQSVPSTTAETYTRTTSAAAPILFADPFGGTTADKLVENTATAAHSVQQLVNTTGGVTMTASGYFKAAERTLCVLFDNSSALNTSVFFDLANGTAYNVGANVTATITPVGNGWYYFTHLTTTQAAQTVYTPQFRLVSTGTTSSYTGDGSSGLLLWGWQVERASTASSYQRITDFTSDFLAAFPTHALYQDSAGTTPVTALGQPVGLVIDKRLGGLANLGPQLITNGDFSSGTTGWSATGTGLLTVVSGQLRVENGAAVTGGTTQTFNTVAGVTYKWIYYVDPGISGGVVIRVRDGGTLTVLSTATRTAAGTFELFFTATGATTQFNAINNSSTLGSFFLIDNVSVREVPGNHVIQASNPSRPTCDARVNLLTFSEQFDNAAWTKTTATITSNAAVAPDGTTTADKFIPNTGVTGATAAQNVGVFALPYTVSIYAKAAEQSAISIVSNLTGAFRANVFNLATGVASPGTGWTASMQPVGNGWFRCACSATGDVAGSKAFQISNNTAGWTGDGTSGVLIWGGDLRLSSEDIFPYQRVVTASDYADVQAPRYLTFDGIDDSLYTAANVDFATWTSGPRRNLLTYPSAFSDPAWSKINATVTANTAIAPDGTLTADLIAESTAASDHYVNQNVTVSIGTHVYSAFIKKGTGATAPDWVQLSFGGVANVYANFNLATGAVGATSATASSIVNAGNGWYRCIVTLSISVAGALGCGIGFTNNADAASRRPSYSGATTSDAFVWGAQLELGTTATTFQDVGTDKVSVFTGVRKLSDVNAGVVVELGANVDTTVQTFGLLAPGTGGAADIRFRSRGSASVVSATQSSIASPVTAVLTGTADIANDICVLRNNGVEVASNSADQGTGTFAAAVLNIGRRNNATVPFNGRIYQLLVRGAATDAATVQQTERWVAQRTGVTL